MLEGVTHTQIHAPVEIVGVEMLSEEAAVTRTEVKLVFHAEDAVSAALAEITAGAEPTP